MAFTPAAPTVSAVTVPACLASKPDPQISVAPSHSFARVVSASVAPARAFVVIAMSSNNAGEPQLAKPVPKIRFAEQFFQ